MLEGYRPADLGFPEYPEFRKDPASGREVQLEVIEFGAYCESRFAAISAPTGIGKMLCAMSVAKITGMRIVILTATKGLQGQYREKFSKHGLVEIKGRTNYDCGDFTELDCRSGSIMGCRYCGGKGCEYERRRDAARDAMIVSANYAYWMTVNDKGGGLQRTADDAKWFGENPVEMLVLDEAVEAPELLSGYLSTKIYEKDVSRWTDVKEVGDDPDVWRSISEMALRDLETEIDEAGKILAMKGRGIGKRDVDVLHNLQRLAEKYERISGIGDDWVIEKREGTKYGRSWSFDVIWPGKYSEKYLFCNVPKIILMSATLRPKTLALLGVSKDQYEFQEWPRVFPANRHPIYSIPAKKEDGSEVRIDYRTSKEDLLLWVEWMDKFIDLRLDRKGLIQSVSYERQSFLMQHSRHSDIMIGNTSDPESETASEVAERFRQTPAPCILVSPSFSTGWDFAMNACEYILICKVPFQPNHGKVMKRREEKDKDYGSYLAMQSMVQGSGRGMRSADDRCEVAIVDGHLSWFLYRNKHLAPDWFVKAVRKIGEIPKAAEKL